MAKLPPDLDLDAVWIEEAMHRGDRETALKLLDRSIARGTAGKDTMRLAGYLRGAKRGRQPFGAKHRWVEIGRDDEEMRARGVPHAERMEKLALLYRLNDESKLKTAIAQYNKLMAEISAIDEENRER